jgi:hypothetical protein
MKIPKFLAYKHCVVNVDNSTAEKGSKKKVGVGECFRYSSLLACVKKPEDNPHHCLFRFPQVFQFIFNII